MSEFSTSAPGSGSFQGDSDHFFDRAYGRNPSLGEVRNIDISSLQLPAREDLGVVFGPGKSFTVIEGVIQDGLERFKVSLSQEEWRTIIGDMRQQCDENGLVNRIPSILKGKCNS